MSVQRPIGADVAQTWYFTFGAGQEHAGRYVVFRDMTFQQARARMVELFGLKWGFQYDESEWTRHGRTQAEQYGLEELVDLVPDPAEVQSIDAIDAEQRLQEVVEWHGLLVTVEDAAALERDEFLYGSLFLADSGRKLDGRRVLRRLNPTTVTVAPPDG